MAIGDGHILLSFLGAFIVFGVLQFFITFEKWIHRYGETRNYRIMVKQSEDGFPKIDDYFKQLRMQAKKGKQTYKDGVIVCTWSVRGKSVKHERLAKKLMNDSRVLELEF